MLNTFDDIKSEDDVANFIMSSPFFDSEYFQSWGVNHGDRKRTRSGRPTADYIRKKLLDSNKHRSIDDDEYFLKRLYPRKYEELIKKEKEIEEGNRRLRLP